MPRITFMQKVAQKWITDISIKANIIKLLEDIVVENLCDLVYGTDF